MTFKDRDLTFAIDTSGIEMAEVERVKRMLDRDVAEFIKNTETVTVPITATATVTFTDTHEEDRADALRYAVESMADRNNIEQDRSKRTYIKPTSVKLK